MPVEKSAGAIVFKKTEDKIYYLLLNYAALDKVEKTYWGFSKGHIEKGEKIEETVKREIEEETGIKDLKFIEDFKETEKYFFKWENKNILKFVTFYLAETKTEDVKISGEHIGYKWLPFEQALERLTFKNAKEILKKAHNFLLKNLTRV